MSDIAFTLVNQTVGALHKRVVSWENIAEQEWQDAEAAENVAGKFREIAALAGRAATVCDSQARNIRTLGKLIGS